MRPHEALAQRPPEPETSGTGTARCSLQGHRFYLRAALAGKAIDLVEIEEELWRIRFCDCKVAVLDVAQGKL